MAAEYAATGVLRCGICAPHEELSLWEVVIRIQHIHLLNSNHPNIPVSSLSAVCGDDLLGDSGHVPRYHQRDDVSHWESRPAYRGISELQDFICSTLPLVQLLHAAVVHQLRDLWVCVYMRTLHSNLCVISFSGRDHSQHLQQYCESGPYPIDGPGLHCISWAAH